MNKQSLAGYTSKKILIVISILAIVLIAGFLLTRKSTESTAQNIIPTPSVNNISNSAPQSVVPADKIEVVHFHGTEQCWSCITVGEYALKTIKEKFPDEYASGKIIYKDVNVELKENQEIVTKFQASGSSLFVNAIRNDKNDISEVTTVWRLVNDENQFITYFENKLNTLLGK